MSSPSKEALLAEASYLMAFACSRVDSLQDAEDLVQDVLVSAWRQRDLFATESSLRTWLTGILRHKILDHYRSLRRTPTRLTASLGLQADGPGVDPLDGLFDAHGSWKAHPLAESSSWRSRELASREVFEAVHHCLGALPTKWQKLFRARVLDGADICDAAQAAGVADASASVILVRAKHRLRLCLLKLGYLG